nr:myosin-5-like isoform X2 [Manis javanica]XP_036852782.1 myosin-5-like isoform X2 [Manis javanica]
METLRPHKQLPLLPLVSTSPRRPRPWPPAQSESPRAPSFGCPLPRHQAPTRHRGPALRIPARGPRAGLRGARDSALPREALPSPPPPPVRSADPPARRAEAAAGFGSGTEGLRVSFPLLWTASGTSSSFCGLSLSRPRVSSPVHAGGSCLRGYLPPKSAETAAQTADTPRRGGYSIVSRSPAKHVCDEAAKMPHLLGLPAKEKKDAQETSGGP